jgi:CheY-like chemotaxis protein
VDDAPEIARIVQHMARRAGQEVVCRGDVPGAWDYLHGAAAEGPPDLVLLDVNLPGASGLELARRVRAGGGAPARLPLALFIQASLTGPIADGLRAGIDFVVPKDLLGRPEEWKARTEEVVDLAANPPSFVGTSGLACPTS